MDGHKVRLFHRIVKVVKDLHKGHFGVKNLVMSRGVCHHIHAKGVSGGCHLSAYCTKAKDCKGFAKNFSAHKF